MKTVVTVLLAFLFIWISLCCGRVLLTGGYRPSFCSLPKETGVCRGAFPRWYYNINSDKCEMFTYGGCDGNKNNFDTRNECEGNCTTNTGKEGDPSQLPELFVGKNARITDKTSVMFRRRLRRDLNSTSSSINNNNQTSKEMKLGNKSNNVSNKPTVRPSQGELSSQTLSSSSKPGTRAPDLTHEDSSGPTSSEANVVNLPENGANAAKPTTPLPTKSQSESSSQTKSSSSKPGTRAPDLTHEDSSGPTSNEAIVVNLPENGANAAKPTTPLPTKSQSESSSQTKSSSSKPGTRAPDLTREDSSGPTSNEANVVNLPEKGDNAAKPTTPLPTKSQSESPSQTKSSSSKPGTRAPDLTQEDSSGPTSSEANVVNLPENGANAAKPTTPLPAKSQGESPSQTLSSSSKLGARAPNLTPENSPDEINSERQLASRGGSKGNDGKSETLSQGKKEKVKSDVKSNKLQRNNARPFHRKGEPIEKTESPPRHPDESSGKIDGLPFQPEELTNEDLDDLDFPHLQTSRKDSAAYPYEHTSSHFAAFFLTSIVMVFAAYVVYHNRQKIIAIVIEGRSDGNGRRRGYRKLETNVEEAMPSLRSSNSTYVY